METIADAGLVQPRESKARPKPKRFRLRNNEAWDRLKRPTLSLVGQFPGMTPGHLTAILRSEGHMMWKPEGANAVGIVQRVLKRLEAAGAIVQAGGWFLTEEASKDGIAEHGTVVAKRGLKTTINALDKVRGHGCVGLMDRRVSKAARVVDELFH